MHFLRLCFNFATWYYLYLYLVVGLPGGGLKYARSFVGIVDLLSWLPAIIWSIVTLTHKKENYDDSLTNVIFPTNLRVGRANPEFFPRRTPIPQHRHHAHVPTAANIRHNNKLSLSVHFASFGQNA